MSRTRYILLAALVAAPCVAGAQVRPHPGGGDPRIQSVVYDALQVVQLQVAPGFQLSVEFAPDERIENVAVGDSGAWQVSANKRGDHLFIKPLQAGVPSNLTVVTDTRSYVFELDPVAGPTPDMPYVVRFQYPEPVRATVAGSEASAGAARYRFDGVRALRPTAMSDDGSKTYVAWGRDQSLPAIFGVDELGKEVLVNGAVRDGRYVIDGVFNRVVFRRAREVASATREPQRKLR